MLITSGTISYALIVNNEKSLAHKVDEYMIQKIPQILQKKSELLNHIQERYEERKRNDRELHSQRLSERGMMIQKSINPFLSTNNYVDDLNIQDQFLRPKDSNIKVDAE